MKQNGFTLIEMLVVVVVIATLAGITFKLVGAGGASSDKAKARQRLEQLANAIEEYRAEYGKYPPVSKNANGEQPMRYEYPGDQDYWTSGGKSGAANLSSQLRGVSRDEATVFVFGLMSYLECRVKGRAEKAHGDLFKKPTGNFGIDRSHWQSENSFRGARGGSSSSDDCPVEDNPRDVRFASKVEPYIKDIRDSHIQSRSYNGEEWTNTYSTVWDPWSHEIRYKSDPPYDSYKIWSIGPDGVDGTADDIVAGREN